MLRFEFKSRRVVIKDFPRRKRCRRVTARAGLSRKLRIEHSFVFIYVTVFTIPTLLTRKDKLLTSFGRLSRKNDIF